MGSNNMCVCEVIRDVIIGIISGLISSAIVSLIFMKHEKKVQFNNDFKDDVQNYHRWILRIRNELEISYRIKDYSSLKRAIEEQPITKTFSSLCEDSISCKKDIEEFVGKLADKTDDKIDGNDYKIYMSILFKYSVETLKFKF